MSPLDLLALFAALLAALLGLAGAAERWWHARDVNATRLRQQLALEWYGLTHGVFAGQLMAARAALREGGAFASPDGAAITYPVGPRHAALILEPHARAFTLPVRALLVAAGFEPAGERFAPAAPGAYALIAPRGWRVPAVDPWTRQRRAERAAWEREQRAGRGGGS